MHIIHFVATYIALWLLLPIRLIINLIARLLFKPNKVFKFEPNDFEQEDNIDLNDYRKRVINNVKCRLDEIAQHGDAVKFISIFAVATKDNEVIEFIKQYVTDDGRFLRKQKNQDINGKGNFSGDMYAGLSYLITELYKENSIHLDCAFVDKFEKAINNALWNKPYGTFKSEYGKPDRGYLFKWFFTNAGHFLPYLISMQLLYKLTKKIRYKLLYLLVFPIAMFDILVFPTFSIVTKRLRYLQWYYIHSNMLYYTSLYKLTKNPLYKYAMTFIKNKMYFDPEFIGLTNDKSRINIMKLNLIDYTHVFKPYKYDEKYKIKAINIRAFFKRLIKRNKKINYIIDDYLKIVPPKHRINDYQWEKALNETVKYNTPLHGIDFVHLLYLYEKIIQK